MSDRTLDAVVIGAGVAGLYQLHQLREQGLDVRAYDTASGVGGTWYWNRYPGAKFDSEAYIYQYLFDEDLYKGWSWSSRFPGQREIEQWLNYVADALDLRRDISFGTTITSAVFDEETNRWTVTTDSGETIDTQYLVTCCGMLSAPMSDIFPGQSDFSGEIFHTARWPRDGVELSGKRVGVIGNGATGIQVIQTIADQVDQLTVFIRTPQYALPMKNPSYGPDDVEAYKARFDELRENLPNTFTGFEYDFDVAWADLTPAQRRERLEADYENGSLKLWLASFAEIFSDEQVSEEVSEFVREKMRARLQDPELRPADPLRLWFRYSPGAVGVRLSRGLSPRQRAGCARQEQPDRPNRPRGDRARGRHAVRTRCDRHGDGLRRRHRRIDQDRHTWA